MATPKEQLLSRTVFDTDGSTTVWDFSFAGGYLDKAHVKAFTVSVLGLRTDLIINPDTQIIGPFQLLLTPALAVGQELHIYRDTPKTVPLVDFTDGAVNSEVALDTNAKQAIFVAAESADLVNLIQVDDLTDLVGVAASAATSASASALAASSSAGDAAASAANTLAIFGDASDVAAAVTASQASATAAAASQSSASTSATTATTQATAAAGSATAAASLLDDCYTTYLTSGTSPAFTLTLPSSVPAYTEGRLAINVTFHASVADGVATISINGGLTLPVITDRVDSVLVNRRPIVAGLPYLLTVRDYFDWGFQQREAVISPADAVYVPQCGFLATINNNLGVTNTSTTLPAGGVTFDTLQNQVGPYTSQFNIATGEWTVPIDGLYNVQVGMAVALNANSLYVRLNNQQSNQALPGIGFVMQAAGVITDARSCSGAYWLARGSTYRVAAYKIGGNNPIVQGIVGNSWNTMTFFGAQLLRRA